MKAHLLENLACPECGSFPLDLQPFRELDGEMLEGVLRCPCQRSFPIIDGVPRMLPANLYPNLIDIAVGSRTISGPESGVWGSRNFGADCPMSSWDVYKASVISEGPVGHGSRPAGCGSRGT